MSSPRFIGVVVTTQFTKSCFERRGRARRGTHTATVVGIVRPGIVIAILIAALATRSAVVLSGGVLLLLPVVVAVVIIVIVVVWQVSGMRSLELHLVGHGRSREKKIL